jgi:phosphoribosyl-ATP pyrophosphohydrolase/phosphoribosyl-AMP cyclohydrolase
LTPLKFDSQGLIVAVAQDHLSGEVRMVAWMNQAALERTLESGLATFYSRSRQSLWTKGETSGNRLKVHSVTADCDGDSLLLSVSPEGPSCHTGRRNCFFNPVDRSVPGAPEETPRPKAPLLAELENIIAERQASTASKSYTKSLLEAGTQRISAKIIEEAGELAEAVKAETEQRVASEAADVVFHLLVGLRARGVSWHKVMEVLNARLGVSGLVEKASRGGTPVGR